jgi:hypothetical protein
VLDETFLTLLTKAYDLRYPDDLEAGYNIVLSQALVLGALDESVFAINRRFGVKGKDGTPCLRFLDALLEANDQRILNANVAFGSARKEQLLNDPSSVYELRVISNGDRFEVHYTTSNISDARLDREAFVQVNDRSFNLAYTRLEGEQERKP